MAPDMKRLGNAIAVAVLASAVVGASALAEEQESKRPVKHVLLLSIDGFHQRDLARWVAQNPQSALAVLSRHGITYSNARTTTPSDSFPGLLAQLTGGTPKTTGVYYDDSYDRTLYSPGPLGCTQSQGTEIVYDESIDVDTTQLFSGIKPDYLPQRLNPDGSCTKVFPHDFLKVNTIFGVAHAAGLQTAWSDKHPAYDIVNGPYVGTPNVDDLYTPEINSNISNGPTSVNGVNLQIAASKCDASNSMLAWLFAGTAKKCQ
jgi:hypothetical protein